MHLIIFATKLHLQMYTFRFNFRLIFLTSGLLFASSIAITQTCAIHLQGRLVDEHNDEPLSLANIYIENTGQGTTSDDQGYFVLTDLCPIQYTLIISHLQCETQKIIITIRQDTSVTWFLEHHEHILSSVTVSGRRTGQEQSHTSHTIAGQSLDKLSGKSLAEMLSTVSGIATIRTGPGISKPVIHGLFGQRIQTVQNGLIQEGQQWGLEHAPEIDPTMAGSISVVKGAAAVKYGGSASAAAIIIEPDPLPVDAHLHGMATLTGMSNHRLVMLSSHLEGGFAESKPWRWRFMTTVKRGGDSHAPDYNLTNTGQQEYNFGFSSGFTRRKDALSIDMTSFNAKTGILRGAHIGNLSDLQEALKRSEPFFTAPFDYAIQNPHQRVHHHLLKIKYTTNWRENHTLKLLYGFQLNQRQEYDVRRGTLNTRPALALNLLSHQLDLSNIWQMNSRLSHETGINVAYLNNRNVPGTGVSPLIPNYRNARPAVYHISRWKGTIAEWDAGIRYDYQRLQAKYFNDQNILLTPLHHYHNLALSAGALWWSEKRLNLRLNAGWNQRNPLVNELYSNGLHHGSAVIEEGDENLHPESSFKITQTWTYEPLHEWHFEWTTYLHLINNFIYLQPTTEPRLTVRGAFPVFIYRQNNARIWGMDFNSHVSLSEQIHWDIKYFFVRGHNREENKPLALIPADRFISSLEIILPAFGAWRNNEFTVSGYKVWAQKRFSSNEDFAPPPPGYFLLDLQVSTGWQKGVNELKLQLGIQNILNTAYRDYLNRLRYYADETGRNIEARIKYIF